MVDIKEGSKTKYKTEMKQFVRSSIVFLFNPPVPIRREILESGTLKVKLLSFGPYSTASHSSTGNHA